jgi:small subunit ribosomal protein S15
MALATQVTAEIVNNYQRGDKDTGSVDVQVALITQRIRDLTEHFKVHKKDVHSKYGLQKLVSQRRKLLKYLKRVDLGRYYELIKRLELRDSY